jgi:hypothetical protein
VNVEGGPESGGSGPAHPVGVTDLVPQKSNANGNF